MSARVVRLAFPSKAEYLILARLAIAGIGRAISLDEEGVADLKLAVTEACANAVKHAYPGGVGEIRVRYDIGKESLVVTVEDDGVGFDATSLDDSGQREEMTEGMGIPLIRAIADDVAVTAGEARGTVVRFSKTLAHDAPSLV